MVEDRITDGKRIAELLSSELSARGSGPLAEISVVDADRDATPSKDGTPAYGIARNSAQIGVVSLFPEYARVTLTVSAETVVESAPENGVPARREGSDAVLRVESGAAVKRAVDLIATAVDG
jgi:hypothetical protein